MGLLGVPFFWYSSSDLHEGMSLPVIRDHGWWGQLARAWHMGPVPPPGGTGPERCGTLGSDSTYFIFLEQMRVRGYLMESSLSLQSEVSLCYNKDYMTLNNWGNSCENYLCLNLIFDTSWNFCLGELFIYLFCHYRNI